MLHITSLDEGLELFKALGSDMRVEILKLLLQNKQMSMSQIATALDITGGALTGHIKKLESCGLITTTNESAGHGNQKLCMLSSDRILIDIEEKQSAVNSYITELKVGHYSDRSICPTCGLATAHSLIGQTDDCRYFDHPDRYNADILWFTKGYVEYTVPNFIPHNQRITGVSISCELASEAPGFNNNWPSDITFHINDVELGTWTSPGDFGDYQGLLTPDWWPVNWNQYGLLKLVTVTEKGTFVDGLKLSNISIQDLGLKAGHPMRFRMSVLEDAANVGGLTIFGKHFGNYGQDIRVCLNYAPL